LHQEKQTSNSGPVKIPLGILRICGTYRRSSPTVTTDRRPNPVASRLLRALPRAVLSRRHRQQVQGDFSDVRLQVGLELHRVHAQAPGLIAFCKSMAGLALCPF